MKAILEFEEDENLKKAIEKSIDGKIEINDNLRVVIESDKLSTLRGKVNTTFRLVKVYKEVMEIDQ